MIGIPRKPVALVVGLVHFGPYRFASDPHPLTLAPSVDLNRYIGRWYVITIFPFSQKEGGWAAISK